MRIFELNKILIACIFIFYAFTSFAADEAIYLSQPKQTKVGVIPACTGLIEKESRGRVSLRDVSKSWPKFRIQAKEYDQLTKFTNFSECLENVESYSGRYDEGHIANLMLGNLSPGMPSEFAMMLLGPPAQSSMSSYMDPTTGKPKTFTFFVWNNQQKRNLLGSALTIAGAATGMSAAAGSFAATQAASIATSAAAAAYSLESLKSARVVTIQVDETNTIQTFSSN